MESDNENEEDDWKGYEPVEYLNELPVQPPELEMDEDRGGEAGGEGDEKEETAELISPEAAFGMANSAVDYFLSGDNPDSMPAQDWMVPHSKRLALWCSTEGAAHTTLLDGAEMTLTEFTWIASAMCAHTATGKLKLPAEKDLLSSEENEQVGNAMSEMIMEQSERPRTSNELFAIVDKLLDIQVLLHWLTVAPPAVDYFERRCLRILLREDKTATKTKTSAEEEAEEESKKAHEQSSRGVQMPDPPRKELDPIMLGAATRLFFWRYYFENLVGGKDKDLTVVDLTSHALGNTPEGRKAVSSIQAIERCMERRMITPTEPVMEEQARQLVVHFYCAFGAASWFCRTKGSDSNVDAAEILREEASVTKVGKATAVADIRPTDEAFNRVDDRTRLAWRMAAYNYIYRHAPCNKTGTIFLERYVILWQEWGTDASRAKLAVRRRHFRPALPMIWQLGEKAWFVLHRHIEREKQEGDEPGVCTLYQCMSWAHAIYQWHELVDKHFEGMDEGRTKVPSLADMFKEYRIS